MLSAEPGFHSFRGGNDVLPAMRQQQSGRRPLLFQLWSCDANGRRADSAGSAAAPSSTATRGTYASAATTTPSTAASSPTTATGACRYYLPAVRQQHRAGSALLHQLRLLDGRSARCRGGATTGSTGRQRVQR